MYTILDIIILLNLLQQGKSLFVQIFDFHYNLSYHDYFPIVAFFQVRLVIKENNTRSWRKFHVLIYAIAGKFFKENAVTKSF